VATRSTALLRVTSSPPVQHGSMLILYFTFNYL
jgi:hypothetical protein